MINENFYEQIKEDFKDNIKEPFALVIALDLLKDSKERILYKQALIDIRKYVNKTANKGYNFGLILEASEIKHILQIIDKAVGDDDNG